MIIYRPSSVVVRRPSTPLNDSSSETPKPVFFKQHVQPSVTGSGWGLKICTNGHGSLIKMAVMPIKTLNNLLQDQESFKAESWYIVYSIEDSGYTKSVQMMTVS